MRTPSAFAFTVTNDGTAPLNVTNVTLGGANPSQFDIVSQDCVSSSPIAFPAGTCTINVRFSPTSLGGKHATIVIASDAGSSAAPTRVRHGHLEQPRLHHHQAQLGSQQRHRLRLGR